MENIVAHSLEKLYTEFENADRIFLESGLKDMAAHEKLSTTAEAAVLVEAAKSSYGRAKRWGKMRNHQDSGHEQSPCHPDGTAH